MIKIFDASALVCFLEKQTGYKKVYDLFKESKNEENSIFIHQINFIEVIYFLFKKHGLLKTKQVISNLNSPCLGIVNYMDSDLAFSASSLKATHQLSLGDAIGMAYTKIIQGQFWTKDRQLLKIAEKEKINLKLIG